ncbi:molybdopterin-containing oxidoreductase family protein [Desulfitobacterium chlororespirans]|uniref:Anaerobic selenocysteine-containing dehydrogenase n=1 Tax=Desulfitobacterium chlororespirans DSM 11544 TaxID=1121395 RepID=A0A1M7SJ20_9FIRM|nr:molybdopterin-dependent oxidoreductase [Desulfitobacterium chlororespirans]SHN58474.1 Anaerobic selenocysteine-containing dehydrogenase [Desulfitobacterium chlororespirans DSM 11544]
MEFKTQNDSKALPWKWEEDGYTVFRSNARTGPGCHDNCGVLMYVKDGNLMKIEGDPENPYNQGRLCPRCLAGKEMIYHPDRLLHPMKRIGARGENKWEKITWDEAYDLCEKKIKEVADKYGSESIVVMQGTGRDINGYGPRTAKSFNTPNYASFLSGNGCYIPRLVSTAFKMGDFPIADYSQFSIKRYEDPKWVPPGIIVIWGNNPVVANSDGTLGHWIVECMKRGSELIVIDPKLTWIASRAKYWLPVRPGTDAALAIAFANVICAEGLEDKEFVKKWTSGFEDFKKNSEEYPPEKVADICGIDKQLIIDAARAFANAESACLQWGVAMDHNSEGFLTGMAILDLVALTGNIEKPGSMVIAHPCFGVADTWQPASGTSVEDEEKMAKQLNQKYPALQAGRMCSPDMILEAMETAEPYPVKALWLQTTNPIVCMGGESKRVLKACQTLDFIAVVDMFMTPTALALADVILPAASFAERIGLIGHQPYYLGPIIQAIEPLGECKSDQQIIYEIGKRFDPTGNPWKNDEEFYNFVLRNTPLKYDELKEQTWLYPEFEYYKHEKGLLREDGQPGFNTSDGKYQFNCETLGFFGLETLASFEEPPESPVTTPELAKEYPLVLTTGARRWGFFHSEHRQSPSMRRLHPFPQVTMNPETAANYGIKEGDWVKIENNLGECRMKAEFLEGMRKDTVSADHAWWFPERDPEDGTLFGAFESNINLLVPMRPGKSGLANSYKTLLCKISKAD